MKAAILDALLRWRDFSGRSTRSQYWWWALSMALFPLILNLAFLLVVIVFVFLDQSLVTFVLIPVFGLLSAVLLVPTVAVSVRRMHDVGKSGWWLLVPGVNLYLLVQPSVEAGRIPRAVFAERVCAAFAALSLLGSFSGDVTASISGAIFWGLIYLALRVRNQRKARQ